MCTWSSLPGWGPNPHWGIHRSLGYLQGLQASGLLLIREMDAYLDRGQRDHPMLLGVASSATILIAYSVEIAIKTLHAQTRLTEKPPQGHNLLVLFDALPQDAKGTLEHAQQIAGHASPKTTKALRPDSGHGDGRRDRAYRDLNGIVPGETSVKATHFLEPRTRIDALRRASARGGTARLPRRRGTGGRVERRTVTGRVWTTAPTRAGPEPAHSSATTAARSSIRCAARIGVDAGTGEASVQAGVARPAEA